MLDRGPALEHGHEVMTTTFFRADEIGARIMPEDSATPFYVALATFMVFESLLWQQWIPAAIATIAVIVALGAWVWPRRDTVETRVAPPADPHPPGQWAMGLLIATEAVLFASLLFAWEYLGPGSHVWLQHPPPGLRVPAINTVVLVASSVTLHLGLRRSPDTSGSWPRRAVLLTIALGASFVALQGWEYAHQDFGPATDAYGSAFVIITGIHGVHVVVGLLMLGFIALMHGREPAARVHGRARIVAWYWHFVDVVWLTVFGVLYVAPHLTR